MKKDLNNLLIVITDKIGDSHSVLSKNNIYCGETLYNFFKYILTTKCKIRAENIYESAGNIKNNIKNEENKPVLYILPECLNITKKLVENMTSITSKENALFYSEKSEKSGKSEKNNKSKKIFACFDSLENTDCFYEYAVNYMPVQNMKDLRKQNMKAQKKIITKLENSGVQFVSLDGVCISPLAKIAPGVVIYPGTIIRGESKIGENCIIGPNTIIENSQIGENCVINSTQIYSSVLENNVKTGPFAHIRPNCVLKNGVKIGDFVEVKNSTLGEKSQASHLTYIGDSDVGERVNFGCGSVTVNYDGMKKARCNIKDDAFIGCNTNLIAPVTIGENAFTAAGSTLTKDVPDNSLAISRSREQKIIENWAKIRKDKKDKKG